jgi:DNA-binding response OmpR family regulator
MMRIEMSPETRCVANVTLYPQLAALTVDGIPIPLSPKEFALARTLFERAGEVVAHERCYAALGGAAGLKSARLLRVYIFFVRQKLQAAGAMTVLVAVRGRGYIVREMPSRRRTLTISTASGDTAPC